MFTNVIHGFRGLSNLVTNKIIAHPANKISVTCASDINHVGALSEELAVFCGVCDLYWHSVVLKPVNSLCEIFAKFIEQKLGSFELLLGKLRDFLFGSGLLCC